MKRLLQYLIPHSLTVNYVAGAILGYNLGHELPEWSEYLMWSVAVAFILLFVSEYLYSREIKAILRWPS